MTKQKAVILIYDEYNMTAATHAMIHVFSAVAALSELEGSAFFMADCNDLNVGHFMCQNVLNLTHNGTFIGSCN